MQFAQIAVLARILTPEDFGLIAVVAVVTGLAQVCADVGISNAIIVRKDPSHEELSTLYWLNFLMGGVLFLILLAIAPLIQSVYQHEVLGSLVVWSALSFLIAPVGQQFQILLQKNLRFDTLARVELAGAVTGLLVSIWTALLGAGVFAFVWGQLTNVTVKSFGFGSLGMRSWRPAVRFKYVDLQRYSVFGLFQMAERIVNYVSWNADKLIIGRLLGAGPLGFYNVAYQLMIRPRSLFAPVVSRVALPVLSSLQDDEHRLRSGYLQITEAIAFAGVPVFVFMFFVADPLFEVIMGPGWELSTQVFKILVWLGIFYSLGNPMGTLLLSKGRADLGFWFNLVALLAYLGSILVGSRWGTTGVAWGLVTATALVLVPLEFYMRWALVRLRPKEYLEKVLPFLFLSLAVGSVMTGLEWILGIRGAILRICFFGIPYMVFYLGSVFLVGRSFVRELMIALRAST